MTERGMIFNGEMVRALLSGRKTQTRRPVKFPAHDKNLGCELAGNELAGELSAGNYLNSAFGKPGDRIWVRETWALLGNEDGCCVDWDDNLCKGDEKTAARIYRASCEQRPGDYGLWSIPDNAYWKPHTENEKFEGTWRPSIHMPRWASRILLEITDVRVERLNAISEEDARAEGIIDGGCLNCGEPEPCGCANPEPDATDAFAYLWQSIYGQENWNANPWVWVIEFKCVEGGAA
ncbi:hypothetical protein [Klebsiella aerogenes]|uniref:hypothetical protein n=1 Tax=Klebsiella aerogenes TaxID=548 RepID=UPI002781DF57|nr:hypothetical protein [Klebsiella aerogenes]